MRRGQGANVKYSSNGQNSDGSSMNVGNKLSDRPSIRLYDYSKAMNSGAAARAAMMGLDPDEAEREVHAQQQRHFEQHVQQSNPAPKQQPEPAPFRPSNPLRDRQQMNRNHERAGDRPDKQPTNHMVKRDSSPPAAPILHKKGTAMEIPIGGGRRGKVPPPGMNPRFAQAHKLGDLAPSGSQTDRSDRGKHAPCKKQEPADSGSLTNRGPRQPPPEDMLSPGGGKERAKWGKAINPFENAMNETLSMTLDSTSEFIPLSKDPDPLDELGALNQKRDTLADGFGALNVAPHRLDPSAPVDAPPTQSKDPRPAATRLPETTKDKLVCFVCKVNIGPGRYIENLEGHHRHTSCPVPCDRCGKEALQPVSYKSFRGYYCSSDCGLLADPLAKFCFVCTDIIVGQYFTTNHGRYQGKHRHPACPVACDNCETHTKTPKYFKGVAGTYCSEKCARRQNPHLG